MWSVKYDALATNGIVDSPPRHPTAAQREGGNLNGLGKLTCKPAPESGRDCLVSSIFASQRITLRFTPASPRDRHNPHVKTKPILFRPLIYLDRHPQN